MNLIYISSDYLLWHYTESFGYIFSFWKNIIWSIFRIFSTKTMFLNLFTPWRRMDIEYPENFSIDEYLSDFIINTLMRIVGFLIRVIFIFFNFIFFTITLVFMTASFFIWILMPILVLALFIYGIKIL